MALEVKWLEEAKTTYVQIISYLEENWSDRDVENFISRTEEVISHIGEQPYMFNASFSKNIRKAVIGKQNSLFYIVRKDEIYLISFWDNRQDPKKNKYRS